MQTKKGMIRKIIQEELKKVFEADYYDGFPDFLDPQFNPLMKTYPPVGMHAYGQMFNENEEDDLYYFLRWTSDPNGDVKRNFSGHMQAWFNTKEDAFKDYYEQKNNGRNILFKPKYDETSGMWNSEPEWGVSGYLFNNDESFNSAMNNIKEIAWHHQENNQQDLALFSAKEFGSNEGFDGEQLFRNISFTKYIDVNDSYDDVVGNISKKMNENEDEYEYDNLNPYIDSTSYHGLAYHGTSLSLDDDEELFDDFDSDYSDWEAVWFGDDEVVAQEFSDWHEIGNSIKIIYKSKIDTDKLAHLHMHTADELKEFYGCDDLRECINNLIDLGYDGWETLGSIGYIKYNDYAIFNLNIVKILGVSIQLDDDEWSDYMSIENGNKLISRIKRKLTQKAEEHPSLNALPEPNKR